MSRVIDKGTSYARSLFVGSAIDDAGLDPYEFRLYAHLKRRAHDGAIWEKQERMAEICGISRKTINEILTRLEEKKWLTQESQTYKGRRSTNLITLLEPPCNPELHGPCNPELHGPSNPGLQLKVVPYKGVKDLAEEKTLPPRTADSVLSAAVPKSANRKKTGEAVAEGEGQGEKATGSGAARPRNLIFDAIVTALYPQGAGSNASQIGKVTAKLSGAGWAAADVAQVIEWRVRDPWWAKRLTLGAFEKHCEDWKRDSGVVRRSLAPVAEPYEDPSEVMFS